MSARSEKRRRTSGSWRVWIATAATLCAAATYAPPALALPPGFDDQLVTSISGGPTDVAWTPDGRMLISSKAGQLRVYKNGALNATPAIDLSARMCTNGERALGGVAVHPNFAVNHHIYLYYTLNKFGSCAESEINGPVNRLSRFTLGDNDVVDPASEQVLFDTPPLVKDHHNGGSVEFGKDGNLYVTVGDGGSASLGWPQDNSRLLGKVVRLTPDGGIPAGNPFTGPSSARCNLEGRPPPGSMATQCQEIFATGLRNPFRSAQDPNAAGVRFFINDVGQHSWEEIDEGGTGFAGANYGWPVREGFCARDSTTDCGPPPPGMTNPIYAYQHGPDGAAVTGGAFVPAGVWPAEYDGDYIFADYVFGAIYRLERDGSGSYTRSDFTPMTDVVSLRFGPHAGGQALYVVTRNGGAIRRISFTGSANRAPTARISATPTSGNVPLSVSFDGRASSDPDGDALTHSWDFDGNGTTDATGATASHTYTTAGAHTARLTVDDGRGGQGSDTVRIDAGNSPPVPVIETPSDGTRFAVGERFALRGSATDPEDGALPASSLTWEVRQHHATHFHPFLEPTTGNNQEIVAPEPEDLDAARTSYLEIRLTATDSSGLTHTVTRELRPKEVDLTFATSPAGLDLVLAGTRVTAPATVRAWEGWNMELAAPDQTDSSGNPWTFASWSDGGAATHTITVPAANASYSATFQPASATTRTFTPVADTQVRSAEPDRNLGTRTSLKTDGSPIVNSYLKYDLSGLGSVASAKLRVFANTGNSAGYDVHGVTDTSWNEATTTWANAPLIGAQAGSSGSFTAGSWTEVDVTSLVRGNGLLSLAMKGRNSTSTEYASRESGASAPQLVVTSSGGSGGDTTPPSVPEGVTATAVSPSLVDVAWQPSTDNTAVTGYSIFRDGVLLDTTDAATQSYQDTNVSPGTTYSYGVEAFDAAGNRSERSAPVSVTTPTGGSRTVTFTPQADAYVKSDSPNSTYGTTSALRTDGSPEIRSYLRFNLAGLGPVTRAVLRVYANSSNSIGYDVRGVANTTWPETTLNFAGAPPVGAIVGSSGRVASASWTEVDVTSLVTGNGLLSLAMTSTSSTATSFTSREGGANAPELVVTTSG